MNDNKNLFVYPFLEIVVFEKEDIVLDGSNPFTGTLPGDKTKDFGELFNI